MEIRARSLFIGLSGFLELLEDQQLRQSVTAVAAPGLPPEDQQRIINDPPTSVDAFTDAVVVAEGLDPVLMATEQRQQVRGLVAAAFGEPVRPSGRDWRHR